MPEQNIVFETTSHEHANRHILLIPHYNLTNKSFEKIIHCPATETTSLITDFTRATYPEEQFQRKYFTLSQAGIGLRVHQYFDNTPQIQHNLSLQVEGREEDRQTRFSTRRAHLFLFRIKYTDEIISPPVMVHVPRAPQIVPENHLTQLKCSILLPINFQSYNLAPLFFDLLDFFNKSYLRGISLSENQSTECWCNPLFLLGRYRVGGFPKFNIFTALQSILHETTENMQHQYSLLNEDMAKLGELKRRIHHLYEFFHIRETPDRRISFINIQKIF
jgi:hypothetical protein